MICIQCPHTSLVLPFPISLFRIIFDSVLYPYQSVPSINQKEKFEGHLEIDSVDPDRTFDVGSKLSGLVAGGFDKLGYITIATAVGQCEGQARYRVEMAVDRQVDLE